MDAEKDTDPSPPPPPPSPPSAAVSTARLKIAGAWSGVLEVQLETWTLPMLRDEVARRSGNSAVCINLICGGKVLRDGDGTQSLLQLGLKNNSKVLASSVSPDHGKAINDEFAAEAERSQKLSRLRDYVRAAATALAGRHADGSLPVEDFNIELEDQSGQKVKFESVNDQRGLMMGLMFHSHGKKLIKEHKYKDALDVLAMGEEAFSLCDPKVVEIIDNIPMLQIDTVWCYFMLRDISCLSMAGMRLAKARQEFGVSHGKDSSRFTILQAGYHAELAIYLRLELLEGVVAYHSGNFEQSRKALTSAQAKFFQLQVPDEALSLLISMGYKERAAKRALRMTGQDVQNAVDFLVEERAKKTRRHEEDIQRKNEIMEQKRYGATAENKPIDLQKLKELVSIGFERYLAVEALRLNENDTQKALDVLTDPERNCELQRHIESQKQLEVKKPTTEDIEELVSMGYERSTVMDAVRNALTKEDAFKMLSRTASTRSNRQANSIPPVNGVEGSSKAAGSPKVKRDEVMEDLIAKGLTGDPLADYDIEITKEGEAITEYMTLLESIASA